MNFVTVAELNKDIVRNLHHIPRDIDLIVGIPRSGMLVATLIALYLNKPLADLDSFIAGKFQSVGRTKNTDKCVTKYEEIRKLLVVEDSCNSGNSVREACKKMEACNQKIEYLILAAYISHSTKSLVDVYFRVFPDQRFFAFNFIHYKRFMEEACVYIDGVLCIDPSPSENDDGEKYREFIRNAKPKYIPTTEIGWLVTSRLEKYREDTEYWLRKNNIKYGKLYMMNLNSAEERRKLGNHAKFKAEIFGKLHNARWFLESEPMQAEEIRKLTGKEVFCVDEMYIHDSGFRQKIYWGIKEDYINKFRSILPQKLRTKLRKIKRILLAQGKRKRK